jgi:hypothetical protein
MGGSSCGFGRVRSRPAMIIKGAKKAAYYPKTRYSPQNLARRLASPFFLPAASSCHGDLKVAQLDKAGAACAEADAARLYEIFCHAAPCFFLLRLLLPPHLLISFHARTTPKLLGGAAGRDEAPAAHSVPTRRATAT